MALPNINPPTGGTGFPGGPIKKVEVPRPLPPKPEPQKEPLKPPEPQSLFKTIGPYVPPKAFSDFLTKDPTFLIDISERSPTTAKKIKDTLGSLLSPNESITPLKAEKLARDLDNAIRFPQSAPPHLPRDPKLIGKLRSTIKRAFNI